MVHVVPMHTGREDTGFPPNRKSETRKWMSSTSISGFQINSEASLFTISMSREIMTRSYPAIDGHTCLAYMPQPFSLILYTADI